MTKRFFLSILVLALFVSVNMHAHAAAFTVTFLKDGDNAATVRVSGIIDSEIVLYYTDDRDDERHVSLGTTDSAGYLSHTVDGDEYGIDSGESVRLVAKATGESVTKDWPYFGSTNLAFPFETYRVPVGEHGSVAITNPLKRSLYVEGNSDSGAASAKLVDGSLEVIGKDDGESTVTICSTDGKDCADLDVIVGSGSADSASEDLSFSQPAPLITVGESTTVFINGSTAAYYIKDNSRPSVVQANAYTSSVTLKALKKGTANVTVCSPGGDCGTIKVTVLEEGDDTELILSPDSLTIETGTTKDVRVSGRGGYHLDVKNDRTVSAELTDNATISIEGLDEGKTSIEVCDRDDNCDDISVTVTKRVLTPPPAPASSAAVFTFSSYLSRGASGFEVTALQQVLAVLGYFTVTANGYFGPATEAAVKAFQAAHGIEQLGVVGPSTRAALNGLAEGSGAPASSAAVASSYHFTQFLSAGMTSTEVTALQKRLTELGAYSGPVTGYFGPLTEAGVKKLQAAHGVSAVGYVGPATRALLN